MTDERERALSDAFAIGLDYLRALPNRHVGALAAAVAADVLTAAWGQNAGLHALSPAAAAAEQVAGEWMLDLLGLPPESSFGLPTGAGLGNAVGLAAAR